MREMTADDLYMSGLGKMGKSQFDEAIGDLERAHSMDPENLDVLLGLSMAHSKKGDQDKAIEVAERAVALHPDDPFPHTNLSMFLQKKGQIEAAEKESAIATQLTMAQKK